MNIFSWQTASTYLFVALRILAVAFFGWLAARSAKKYILRETEQLPHEALRLRLLARIITYAIYMLVGLTIIRDLGIQTTALMGIFGIIGISLGFAMQGSLANIVSGIFLMAEHPYEIGDTITSNNLTGQVVESTLYATILQTADKKIIRIPHDQLIKSSITIEKK